MTKGNYDFNGYHEGPGYANPRSDTSFRNCICAILIFIAMCILIVIAATVIHVKNSGEDFEPEEDLDENADAMHGSGFSKTTFSTERTEIHSTLMSKLITQMVKSTRPTARTTAKNKEAIKREPLRTTPFPLITTAKEITSEVYLGNRFGDVEIITNVENVTKIAERKQPLIVLSTNQMGAKTTVAVNDAEVTKNPKEYNRSTQKSSLDKNIDEGTTEIITIQKSVAQKESNGTNMSTMKSEERGTTELVMVKKNMSKEGASKAKSNEAISTVGGDVEETSADVVVTSKDATENISNKAKYFIGEGIEGSTTQISVDKSKVTEETWTEELSKISDVIEKVTASVIPKSSATVTNRQSDSTPSIREIKERTTEVVVTKNANAINNKPKGTTEEANEDYSKSSIKDDAEGTTESATSKNTSSFADKNATEVNTQTTQLIPTHSVKLNQLTSSTESIQTSIRSQSKEKGQNSTIEKRDDDEEDAIASTEPVENEIVSEWSGDYTPTKRVVDPPIMSNVSECKSRSCISTASKILGLMNHSEEACNDFYSYSCGGRLQEMDDDDYMNAVRRGFFDALDKVDDKSSENFLKIFKAFYKSCVIYEDSFQYSSRIQAAKEVITETGGLILDDSIQVNKTTLTKLFTKLVLIKSFPLIKTDVVIDPKSGKFSLVLTLPNRDFQSDPVLSDWPTWLEDDRKCFAKENRPKSEGKIDMQVMYEAYSDCRHSHLAYSDAVKNVLEELQFYAGLPEFNRSQQINEYMFTMEADVMRLVEKVDVSQIYQTENYGQFDEVRLYDLQQSCDIIDWQLFYEEATGSKAAPETTVRIGFYNEIKKIMKKFQREFKERKFYNTLLIMYATDFYQNAVLPKRKSDRENYCLDLSTSLFPDVASHVYMKISNGSSLRIQRESVEAVFDLLKGNLIEGFEASDWLENQDANLLIKRTKALNVVMQTTSSSCIDPKRLTYKYNVIDQKWKIGKNFSRDYPFLLENRQKGILSLVGRDFDGDETFCHFLRPFDRKPKAFYPKDVIAVPYGMMERIPWDSPGYIFMARVGIHLAVEMMKYFDTNAINEESGLSDEALSVYNKLQDIIPFPRTRWVNKQLVEFTTTEFTFNAEIVDNAALRLVSDVYDKWHNNLDLPWVKDRINKTTQMEQIFYVSLAQEFCQKDNLVGYMLDIYERGSLPSPMRVESMVVNSRRFAGIFDCAEGSEMNTAAVDKKQFPHLDEISSGKKKKK